MDESREEEIARLLREGLDHYGEDEISSAIVTWKRVLELDPENEQAIDFIRNADRRTAAEDGAAGARGASQSSPNKGLLREARVLMAEERWDAALERMRSVDHGHPDALDVEAMTELARSRLFLEHKAAVGEFASVPHLKSDIGAVTDYDLPRETGFLLSMVDGMTSVEELVSLSGMDAFATLDSLRRLLDAGLVEMRR